MKIMTPTVRRWLYGVTLAAAPLVVAAGLIQPGHAPLWISLAGALLAVNGGVAGANVERAPKHAAE